jgi:AraC-like DNA-binding protein
MAWTVGGHPTVVLEESATLMPQRRPTTSTRGILRPEAVGRVFELRRTPPVDELAHLIERHWVVSWDLRGRPPYRQEVAGHPCVNLVFEPHGAAVFGVHRRPDSRTLTGRGWAVGTKFRPGGFSGFYGRPVHELTDRFARLEDVFGRDGARLADHGADAPDPQARIAAIEAFLRDRLPPPDPEIDLVHEVVLDMLEVVPGTTVDALARRHAVSTRTLQRLFRRHVGVGPKWVLRRYRLHEAAEQLAAGERHDWTSLALDLGYFDHAHFIRDFRAVVGRSPAEYEAQCAALAAA